MNAGNARAYLTRFKGVFNGFTTGQRTVTVIAVVVAIIGGLVFMSWLQKPTMTPLFTNLSSTDASSITAKLAEGGTAYELADSGRTVLVSASDVNQKRIDLAGAGLPVGSQDGSSGYSLLDKQGISSSDRQQRMSEKRAIEGELQNAIQSIDKVSAAKVLLALPEQNVFSSEQEKTTASVVVTMRTYATLDSGKVDAIVHLVAGAVPNLDSKDVTVTDANGTLLNAPGTAGSAGGAYDARMAQTQAKSAALSAKIQSMLDKAVGPGNASVSVEADLNFDDTSTETNEYITPPSTAKPLTDKSSTEKYTGAGTVPQGGVLGPDSTLVPSSSGSSGSDYTGTKSDVTNPYGTKKTTTTMAGGGVRRLSVAVMLNSSAATVSQTEVTKLVSAAAGVDTTRGDVVTVTKMAFDTKAAEAITAAAEADASAERQDQLLGIAKNAVLGLAIVLALLIGFKKSRKKVDEVDLGELPSAGGRALPQLPAGGAALTPLEYTLDDDLPVLEATGVDPQSHARLQARAEIGALVTEDTDEVARLLRGWIQERS